MMPCFVCGEDSSEWSIGIYYGSIMILHNIGWALSQVTHLALIPEIAKRPSEMVELHGLRSGFTFLSGIFVYAITWIVLRTDDGDEKISYSQWKDFMKISLIVVGTGCFFALIFHLGTKEPPAAVENRKGPFSSFMWGEKRRILSGTLSIPDKTPGVFSMYKEKELGQVPEENWVQTEATPKELKQEEHEDIEDLETSQEKAGTDSRQKRDIEVRVADLRKSTGGNEFSFANPAFCTNEKLDFDREKIAEDSSENSGIQTQEKHGITNEFSFSNPAFLSEDKQSDSNVTSPPETNQVGGGDRNDVMAESQSNRSDCSDASEGYASSPENNPDDYIKSPHTTTILEIEKPDFTEQDETAIESNSSYVAPRSLSSYSSRGGLLSKTTDASFSGDSVIIEILNDHGSEGSKTNKSWSYWFKTPLFYKISFAFMCARLVQVLSSSYVPLYLTETLGFEKASIAYFPLVILISSVISSLAAKKLDKMLGEKWTYCLAASLVVGSSAWFYLQGESGKNAAYCAAILVGCGSSVMYVTSLALAGKLVGDNKESGAFVFASMCILAKVACGTSILVIQELFPTDGGTAEYVRYAFSVVPGTASFLGFLAVIAFLPATMKCKKVVDTADCSVQTEDITKIPYTYENRATMGDLDGDYKEDEFVTDDGDKARAVC
ncbi:uncharacterized protein LOC111326264 [Stylophora pistillata]|uniref:uncharacterized protein LOC111326264 n=1 Tax=Stylophora pistillata TaxID=50429 RepID=UPI000C04381C|nr:uncharacterized protein LOC111326264 [Stylophora pistillata]